MALSEAREALRAEQRKLRAERDAFREFDSRVGELTLSHPPEQQKVTRSLQVTGRTSAIKLIRGPYKETIMDVPHYNKEYGETFLENVRVELGPEIAKILEAGTVFTPPLKQTIRTSARTASERREMVLAVLETEASMLENTATFCDEVQPLPDLRSETTFERLCALAEQLEKHESRAEMQLMERQQILHNLESHHSRNGESILLSEYLYDSLSTNYPILQTLTRLLEDVRNTRSEIAQRIAGWQDVQIERGAKNWQSGSDHQSVAPQ